MALSQPELASDSVLLALKVSRLKYSCQETPYSCYITIRKKFSQKFKSEMPLLPNIENLKTTHKCKQFENLVKESTSLRLKVEEADKIKEEIYLENQSLQAEKEFVEKACGQKVAALRTEMANQKLCLERQSRKRNPGKRT